MNEAFIADLFREGLWLIFLSVVILIVPSLIVGLVVSTFQAATQINEQTLSFLPRLLVTILVIIVAGPYLVTRLVDYTQLILFNLNNYIG
ncbi:flagellar biosynthesis protein FliQ [Salinibius halmophilus]|uniref:flagellar biosynthesis protein FliQ n=1 Tax=Salinibius halmophilus TaxID=1853216 RepID=UPI000E66703F|nr:flagellar biosynthesis protein FliQ [Salinibius halmophilus]